MKELNYEVKFKMLKVRVCEDGDHKLDGVEKVVEYCKELFDPCIEEFYAFILDSKNRLLEFYKSKGTINENVVYPRELFRRALQMNGVNIILAHNHPSGEIQPSRADLQMTKRLSDGARLLGLVVLDHIIFTPDKYTSFVRERLI
jgi:DNA repair protein RadC